MSKESHESIHTCYAGDRVTGLDWVVREDLCEKVTFCRPLGDQNKQRSGRRAFLAEGRGFTKALSQG